MTLDLWMIAAIAVVEIIQIVWLFALSFALVAQRHRYDRLTTHVRNLGKRVSQVSRMRTKPMTGEQPNVKPRPPFPVPPPSTNPISSTTPTGRHSAIGRS